jgi:hypothetical protein
MARGLFFNDVSFCALKVSWQSPMHWPVASSFTMALELRVHIKEPLLDQYEESFDPVSYQSVRLSLA